MAEAMLKMICFSDTKIARKAVPCHVKNQYHNVADMKVLLVRDIVNFEMFFLKHGIPKAVDRVTF